MSEIGNFDLFVSVNPELRSKVGHPFFLDSGLKEAVEETGPEFLSFGSKSQEEDIRGIDFVQPVFTLTSWEVFQDGSRDLVSQHVEEFVEAFAKISDGRKRVLVYWYMGTAEVFHELGRIASDLDGVDFCLHLFSGFFLAPSSFTTAHLLHAGRLLELLSETDLSYSIVSDSEKLRKDLKQTTGVECNPVPAFASQKFDLKNTKPSEEKRIELVYPTDDSTYRGFDLLIDFLREHADRFRGSLHFSIRVYPGNRKEIDQEFANQFGNVDFIEGKLSEEDFQDLLLQADVVLLPYVPELFYYRTSSILYEAMAAKKPVVVIDETWLSERVESLGGGWVSENSVDGLKSVFEEIANAGPEGVQEKAHEISPVPQIGDLFKAIVTLSFSGADFGTFEPRFSKSDVDSYYESEKEKSRTEKELGEAHLEIARLERKTDYLESELNRIVNSKTWRYTESLREFAASVKERRRKGVTTGTSGNDAD